MSECPGDPQGHHWHLEAESTWTEGEPWPPMSLWFRVKCALVPFFGWMWFLLEKMEHSYPREVRIGVRRRWYCELCRAFETTEHPDGT